MKEQFLDFMFKVMIKKFEQMAKNPEKITASQAASVRKLHEKAEKVMGLSENGKWCIDWKVDKFENKEAYEKNTPYDTVVSLGNIILDSGANEMLKVICGIEGATPFNNTNAKIGVGTNTTPENASQNGLIATDPNAYYKAMESGYPQVSGRTMIFKSVFNDDEANFAWQEFSIVNGQGVGGKALNRKVQDLGKKTTGIWALQITISVTSNA